MAAKCSHKITSRRSWNQSTGMQCKEVFKGRTHHIWTDTSNFKFRSWGEKVHVCMQKTRNLNNGDIIMINWAKDIFFMHLNTGQLKWVFTYLRRRCYQRSKTSLHAFIGAFQSLQNIIYIIQQTNHTRILQYAQGLLSRVIILQMAITKHTIKFSLQIFTCVVVGVWCSTIFFEWNAVDNPKDKRRKYKSFGTNNVLWSGNK